MVIGVAAWLLLFRLAAAPNDGAAWAFLLLTYLVIGTLYCMQLHLQGDPAAGRALLVLLCIPYLGWIYLLVVWRRRRRAQLRDIDVRN